MEKYEPCQLDCPHKGEQYVEGIMPEINLAAIFCGNCGAKYSTLFEKYGIDMTEE